MNFWNLTLVYTSGRLHLLVLNGSSTPTCLDMKPMIVYLFVMFLDTGCKYLIDDLCIYVHNEIGIYFTYILGVYMV